MAKAEDPPPGGEVSGLEENEHDTKRAWGHYDHVNDTAPANGGAMEYVASVHEPVQTEAIAGTEGASAPAKTVRLAQDTETISGSMAAGDDGEAAEDSLVTADDIIDSLHKNRMAGDVDGVFGRLRVWFRLGADKAQCNQVIDRHVLSTEVVPEEPEPLPSAPTDMSRVCTPCRCRANGLAHCIAA